MANLPNFDWSHLPLDWYEFIGGEANESSTEHLKASRAFQFAGREVPAGATFDAEYYARLPCWTVPMALQLLNEMDVVDELNWEKGIKKKIRESLRLSYSGRDGWLMISLFPEKDGKGQTLVNAHLFCNWADTKGFRIWRTIREAQIGFDENRNTLTEEYIKMLAFHKAYKERLQKEVPCEQEVVKTKAPQNKRHEESRRHKIQVQKIAKQLWKDDKTLTIQDVIICNEVNSITKSNGGNYSETTLRNWVKYLAQSNKAGRRPKKN